MHGRKLVCLMIAVSFSLIVSPSIGSWFQVGIEIEESDVQERTNQASSEYLHALVNLLTAFRAIDDGNFDAAGAIGIGTVQALSETRERFESIRDYLQENDYVRHELDSHLTSLDLDDLRRELGGSERESPLSRQIEEIAFGKGSIELFNEAVNRISSLERHCQIVFAPIREARREGYDPLETARLLIHASNDLEFGAYVSAIYLER